MIPEGPRLGGDPSNFRLRGTPIVTVMIGSMLPILPIIAQTPVLPPLGLLLLLSWRLLRPELLPAWVAVPLGLFDDIMSGQPLGSAVCLWTITMIGIDMAERRLIWRDYWQDWLIAAIAVIFCITGGLWFARLTGGGATLMLVAPQILWSILLYPFVARQCAWLDRWRIMA